MAWDFLDTDEENVIQPSGGGGFSQIYDPIGRTDRDRPTSSPETTQAAAQDQQSTLQATYSDGGREGGLPEQPQSQPITTLTQLEQAQTTAKVISSVAGAVSPVPGVGTALYGMATFSNINEFARNLGGIPDNDLEFKDLFDIGQETIFGGASFGEAARAQRFGPGRFDVGARTKAGTQQRKTAAGVQAMAREGLSRQGRPTARREAILDRKEQQAYESAMSSLSTAERSVVERTSGGDRARASSIARGISAARASAARARQTARDYVRERGDRDRSRGGSTGGGETGDLGSSF